MHLSLRIVSSCYNQIPVPLGFLKPVIKALGPWKWHKKHVHATHCIAHLFKSGIISTSGKKLLSNPVAAAARTLLPLLQRPQRVKAPQQRASKYAAVAQKCSDASLCKMKALVLVCFLAVVFYAAGLPIAEEQDLASATNVPSSADSFDGVDALLESQEVTAATDDTDAHSEAGAAAAFAAAQAGLDSQAAAAKAQAQAEAEAASAALAAAAAKAAAGAKAAASAKAKAEDVPDAFVHSDPNDKRLPAIADAVKDAIDSGRKSCSTKAPGGKVRSVRVVFARHQLVSRGDLEYEVEVESIDVHGFEQVFLANVRWRHADDARYVRVDGKTVQERAQIVSMVPSPCAVGDAAILIATSAQVEKINAQKLPWTASVSSKFRGKTLAEMSYLFNAKLPQLTADTVSSVSLDVALPEAYDARDTRNHEAACVAFQPKDQGQCGSCYAFGATSALAARMCMTSKHSLNFDLSFQETMECVNGCNGGWSKDVYTAMYTKPSVPDQCEPYKPVDIPDAGIDSNTCGAYSCAKPFQVFTQKDSFKIYTGMSAIQQELLTNGPGVVVFDVFDDFFTYQCVRFRVKSLMIFFSLISAYCTACILMCTL